MKILYALVALLAPLSLCGMEKAKPAASNQVNTQLFRALYAGKFDEFRKCLSARGFDVNYRYPNASHKTLFMILCVRNNDIGHQALDVFLEYYASRPGQLDTSIVDQDDLPALHRAIEMQNGEALQKVLHYKDKISLNIDQHKNVTNRNTALNTAVMHSKKREALLLLQAGANPNIPDKSELYPLHRTMITINGFGCNPGEFDIMIALAEYGAQITCVTKGKTLLEYAFLSSGTGAYPMESKRALGLLAIGCRLTGTENLKLEHFNSCQEITKDYPLRMPLHESPENKLFLEKSFAAAIQNTALDLRSIPQVAIRVNTRDLFGMTALHWAAARGNLLLAKQLAQLDADASVQDAWGNTALHIAVRNGHAHMIPFLMGLHRRALIVKNMFDHNPVDIAQAANKSVEVLEALGQK